VSGNSSVAEKHAVAIYGVQGAGLNDPLPLIYKVFPVFSLRLLHIVPAKL